jgi:hypothetical protein
LIKAKIQKKLSISANMKAQPLKVQKQKYTNERKSPKSSTLAAFLTKIKKAKAKPPFSKKI